MNGRDSPPCCHQVHPKSHRLHHLRRWGRNFSETWGWSHESQAAAPEEVKKALYKNEKKKKSVSIFLEADHPFWLADRFFTYHEGWRGAGTAGKGILRLPVVKGSPTTPRRRFGGFLEFKAFLKETKQGILNKECQHRLDRLIKAPANDTNNILIIFTYIKCKYPVFNPNDEMLSPR